jgi:hypothetical protein
VAAALNDWASECEGCLYTTLFFFAPPSLSDFLTKGTTATAEYIHHPLSTLLFLSITVSTAAMPSSFDSSEWLCRKDPRTQRTYYVNCRTGRSTWDPAHRTAVDAELASTLHQAVVPAAGLSGEFVEPASLTGVTKAQAASHVDALLSQVPSSRKPTEHRTGQTRSAMDGRRCIDAASATESRDRPTSPVGSERMKNTHSAASSSSSSSSSNSSSVTTQASADLRRSRPASPFQKMQQQFSPSAPSAASPLSFRVPFSSSVSLSDQTGMRSVTPLGTSPLQRGRSPVKNIPRGVDFLTASGVPASSRSPTDTNMHSPLEHTTTSPLSYSSDSPMRHRLTVATESSTSFSLSQTQRPSDNASLPLTDSASRRPQMSPSLPLPSLVPAPVEAGMRSGSMVGEGAEALHTTDVHGKARGQNNADMSLSAAPSSPPAEEQQQELLQDAGTDPEVAAAEEWRLTQLTWGLEGERARLESEVAVLRGPVEVETQSIAEEQDRLVEAQRALEAASAFAVHRQRFKRKELAGLQQRLCELQLQRSNWTFLLSSLQERARLLTERCQSVCDAESQLKQQRKELEGVMLPREEAALRDAQHRLYDQRQRLAAQQQQLEERERLLTQTRGAVQRLTNRLSELSAIPLDESVLPDNGQSQLSFVESSRENRALRDSALSRTGADGGALAVIAAGPTTCLFEHGKQLQARITALRREIASVQAASRALYENRVLLAQQQVLLEWVQQLRGEVEDWQPPMDEARAMRQELRQLYKTQECKYAVNTASR